MYHLSEDHARYWLSDVMEFHFIEMPKLIKFWKEGKLNPWDDVLARWLLLLGMVDHRHGKIYDEIYNELEEIAMQDESLRDAFKNWEELSMTKEQVLQYESRLKVLLDKESERRHMEKWKQSIEGMQKDVDERQKDVDERQKVVDERQKDVDERQKVVDERQKDVDERQKVVDERQKAVNEKENNINERQKRVDEREKQLTQTIGEAAYNAKKAIAMKLLKSSLEIDLIAESTGLDKDTIMQIKHEIDV